MTRIDDNRKNEQALREQRRVADSKATEQSRNRSDPMNATRIPFDTVLAQTKQAKTQNFSDHLGKPSESKDQTVTEQGIREASREGEDKSRSREDRLRNKDHDGDKIKDEAASSTKDSLKAKEAERKVISRAATQEHRQRGESGEHKESLMQGGRQKGQKGLIATDQSLKRDTALKTGAFVPGEAPGATRSFSGIQTTQATQAPATLPKAVLDQIVQYVRLMSLPDGKKEMEIQLHEKIFKGLRLKVALSDGKLTTTLMTGSEEARALLEANKGLLASHLSEKGIDIQGIDVILLSSR